MKVPDCDVCNGPEIYGELPEVVASDTWRVELNPNQQHLGRTFVGLRDHKPSLSELTAEEMAELHRIIVALEMGARAAFSPDLFNWMCLMNNAKRDDQQPHVHWHMVPRYSNPVKFGEHTYTDSAWPRQYNTGTDGVYLPTYEEICEITQAIRDGIERSAEPQALVNP